MAHGEALVRAAAILVLLGISVVLMFWPRDAARVRRKRPRAEDPPGEH